MTTKSLGEAANLQGGNWGMHVPTLTKPIGNGDEGALTRQGFSTGGRF
jgi:hypothetical protein